MICILRMDQLLSHTHKVYRWWGKPEFTLHCLSATQRPHHHYYHNHHPHHCPIPISNYLVLREVMRTPTVPTKICPKTAYLLGFFVSKCQLIIFRLETTHGLILYAKYTKQKIICKHKGAKYCTTI